MSDLQARHLGVSICELPNRLKRLARREGLLLQPRCTAGEGFALTIEPSCPSLRSYDLVAHRSQIALRFEDRSKRKR